MNELGAADFGDARITRRLVRVAQGLAARPGESIPDALQGWPEVKAAYRFFDNPAVAPTAIMDAHRESTLARCALHERVLFLHDTSTFSFSKRRTTTGLGPIAGRASNVALRGFYQHAALAVTTDGLPLGIVAREVWARKGVKRLTINQRAKLPTLEKESGRWIRVAQQAAQGVAPSVRAIDVADREADMHEFLATCKSLGHDFLVRAVHERRLADAEDTRVWEYVENLPPAGTLTLDVDRTHERQARRTTLEIRFARLSVRAPRDREGRLKGEPIETTAVVAIETNPPKGEEAIEWKLYTSLPVTNLDEASECLRLYAIRWRIERFHYTLKSGANIEDLQLESADRIWRALAIFNVIAWRLLALTYQARLLPTISCEVAFTQQEWHALCRRFERKVPPNPPNLQGAVRYVARLGGFLNRKGDGDPGVKVLWRGFRELAAMVRTYDDLAEDVGNG